jgi:hypothetical protein
MIIMWIAFTMWVFSLVLTPLPKPVRKFLTA